MRLALLIAICSVALATNSRSTDLVVRDQAKSLEFPMVESIINDLLPEVEINPIEGSLQASKGYSIFRTLVGCTAGWLLYIDMIFWQIQEIADTPFALSSIFTYVQVYLNYRSYVKENNEYKHYQCSSFWQLVK